MDKTIKLARVFHLGVRSRLYGQHLDEINEQKTARVILRPEADMLMDQAFNLALGRDRDMKCPEDKILWSRAWDMAIQQGFDETWT